MNTSARVLRASADRIIHPSPFLTPKEREKRSTIVSAGRTVMAQFGRHAIGMKEFAQAIHIPAATIRRHFADLDNLLGTILREHLMCIVTALGAVPQTAPNRAEARRAAYLAATRTALGAPSEAHLLLIRDRHLLPPDEQDSVETIRANIGDILAGEQAELTLALLDTPQIHPSRMEVALAALLGTPVRLDMPEATLPASAVEPAAAAPLRPVAPTLVLHHALKAPRPAARLAEEGIDWPAPAPWERAAAAAAAAHNAPDIKEAPRRASS